MKTYTIIYTTLSFIVMIVLIIGLLFESKTWSEQDVAAIICVFLIALAVFIMGIVSINYELKKDRDKARRDREIIRANREAMDEFYKSHIE